MTYDKKMREHKPEDIINGLINSNSYEVSEKDEDIIESLKARERSRYDVLKHQLPCITSDLRIDMNQFSDVYRKEDIEDDINWVFEILTNAILDEYSKKIENLPESKREVVTNQISKVFKENSFLVDDYIDTIYGNNLNRMFEIAKTVIFNEYFCNGLIVCRSSLYDDFENNVDNLIIDKKNGDIICAFDEVFDLNSAEKAVENKYKRKKKLINQKCRLVRLKYGVSILEKNGEKNRQVIKGSFDKIPWFVLSISKKDLLDLLKNLGNEEYERNFLDILSNQIKEQIKDFSLSQGIKNEDKRIIMKRLNRIRSSFM